MLALTGLSVGQKPEVARKNLYGELIVRYSIYFYFNDQEKWSHNDLVLWTLSDPLAITCPWKYNWLQNYHALCKRVFYACPTGIFEWSFNASAHTKCKQLLQIIRLPPIICLRASLGENINQDLLIYSFETRYLQIYLRWI